MTKKVGAVSALGELDSPCEGEITADCFVGSVERKRGAFGAVWLGGKLGSERGGNRDSFLSSVHAYSKYPAAEAFSRQVQLGSLPVLRPKVKIRRRKRK